MLENVKIPRYDLWYRKFGIRRQNQLLQPYIFKGDTFLFPMFSIYHNITGISETPTMLDRNTDYLKTHPTIFVREIFRLNNPPTIAKELPVMGNNIITKLAKNDKTIKFLKEGQELPLLKNTLYVYDYNYALSTYRFKFHRFKYYYQYLAYWDTILNNLNTMQDRKDYIRIELPDEPIPYEKLQILFKYNEYNMVVSKILNTYRDFNYYELVKLFHPDHKHNSIFNPVDKGNIDVDILLTNGKNAIHIPYIVLYSISIDNGDEIGIKDIFPGIRGFKRFRTCLIVLNNFLSSLRLGSTTIVDQSLLDEEHLVTNEVVNHMVDEPLDEPLVDEPIENHDGPLEQLVEVTPEEAPIDIGEDEEDLVIQDTNDTNILYAIPISSKAKKLLNYEPENIDIDQVRHKDNTKLNKIETNIDFLVKSGQVSTTERKNILHKLEEQSKIKIPYIKNTPLKDILDQTKDNIKLEPNDYKVSDNKSVLDKSCNKNILNTYSKNYIKDLYKKDIVRSIYGIQNTDAMVTNYQVEETKDISGTMEKHTFNLYIPGAKTTKGTIFLPKIEEDGTFRMDGNTYRIKLQRRDDVIRKIDYSTVSLSTYYGKCMITKGHRTSTNVSAQILKLLEDLKAENKIENLIITDNNVVIDKRIPKLYSQVCFKVLGFKHKNITYTFDYNNRGDLLGVSQDDVIKQEKNNEVLVGLTNKNEYVFMDIDGNIKVKDDNLGNLLDILEIDPEDIPTDSLTMKVIGKHTNLGDILLLYYGLENLLKVLEVNYTELEANKRVSNVTINIKTADKTFAIDKENNYKDSILASLAKASTNTRKYTTDDLNKRERVVDYLFNTLGGGSDVTRRLSELNSLEDLFIDPISAGVLSSRGIQPNFPNLLIVAAKMLDDNYTMDPRSIKGMVVKGYERVAGMVYQHIAKQVAGYNAIKDYGKKDITIDPYAIKNILCEDSTSIINDDLNPITDIKIKEDITQLGLGGLKRDSLRNADSRRLSADSVGIISEAIKDSGDAGINNLAVANPGIVNLRGEIEIKDNLESWSEVLSSVSMLGPFLTHDDPKRLNFSVIHAGHIIPLNKMVPPYVRTGYESIIAIKSSPKFCVSAEDDGVVTSVTDKEVTVKYTKLGEKKYRLYEWTSKEETHACYTHYVVTSLKKGDRVTKDDTITYDRLFFTPDIFNPKRVIYKQGTSLNVALMDDMTTFEDSIGVSKRAGEILSTTITKIVQITMSKDQEIYNLVKIGDHIEIDEPVCSIMNDIGDDTDAETLKLLKEINTMSPRSNYSGTISKIHCIYNFDPKDATTSVRKVIQESDKGSLESTGYTGKVQPSFRLGKDIMDDDTMIIRIYILVNESGGMGDKMVVANQLKCTIGDIFDETITTESGDEVDVFFSYKSLGARIVMSPFYLGILTRCLEAIERKAIERYFN